MSSIFSVLELQDKYGYYRIYGDRKLARVQKGDINLYYHISTYWRTSYTPQSPYGTFTTKQSTRTTRYFDTGISSKPLYLTSGNLTPYIQGCPSCASIYAKYNKIEKQNKIWKYVNWTAAAGGITMYLVAGSDLSEFEAYSFVGLVGGSVISGIFRRVQQGRNVRRIEDVIAVYNRR